MRSLVNNYSQELSEYWDDFESSGSKALMREYDRTFRLCTAEKEQCVYDTFAQLLRTKSPLHTNSSIDDYVTKSVYFIRVTKYLNRFWLPHQIQKNPSIKPLVNIVDECLKEYLINFKKDITILFNKYNLPKNILLLIFCKL